MQTTSHSRNNGILESRLCNGQSVNGQKVRFAQVGNNKAPGLDEIQNKALMVTVKFMPAWFIRTFESYIVEGMFSTQWKEQRLVLFPKLRKPLGVTSSCLLDCFRSSS